MARSPIKVSVEDGKIVFLLPLKSGPVRVRLSPEEALQHSNEVGAAVLEATGSPAFDDFWEGLSKELGFRDA